VSVVEDSSVMPWDNTKRILPEPAQPDHRARGPFFESFQLRGLFIIA